MIAGIKALAGALFGKVAGELDWIVLLIVAGAAAYFYADGRQVRADRAAIEHAAELICAGAGTPFAASVDQERAASGKLVTITHARGALCQRAVADLAGFKARTNQATAETLAQALKDHDARAAGDTAASLATARALADASARMEKVDAQVPPNDRVGADWFAAVNDVAGLRAPRD